MGLGTHLKYYIEEGQAFNDITPLRGTQVTSGVTFTTNTTSGTESQVIVNSDVHGGNLNDLYDVYTYSDKFTMYI